MSLERNESPDEQAKSSVGIMNLYYELNYLRYIMSKIIESDEKLKEKIDSKTFLEAQQFALNEMRFKFNIGSSYDQKTEEKKAV